jgi:hypothetical protein
MWQLQALGGSAFVNELHNYMSAFSTFGRGAMWFTNNHYKDVINANSDYIWWTDYLAGSDWGTSASGNTFTALAAAGSFSLAGGVDDYTMSAGQQQTAYALFANAELYDVSLIIAGKANAATAKIIADLAQTRADCVAFISPQDNSTGDVITIGLPQNTGTSIGAFVPPMYTTDGKNELPFIVANPRSTKSPTLANLLKSLKIGMLKGVFVTILPID